MLLGVVRYRDHLDIFKRLCIHGRDFKDNPSSEEEKLPQSIGFSTASSTRKCGRTRLFGLGSLWHDIKQAQAPGTEVALIKGARALTSHIQSDLLGVLHPLRIVAGNWLSN